MKSATEQLHLMTSGFRKEEIAESDAQLSQARANLDAAKLRGAGLQGSGDAA